MYKGGEVDMRVDIGYVVFGGNESTEYGSRAVHFPVEMSIKMNGEDLGEVVVVNNNEEYHNLIELYQGKIDDINEIIRMVLKGQRVFVE